MPEIEELQDSLDIEKKVRNIIGLKGWSEFKQADSTSEQIGVLTTFITDSYSFFFENEETMEELAYSIELLTSFDDDDYELTDNVIKSILGIDAIVEKEKDIDEEIKVNIKTLLVYMLEILQNEPPQENS